MMSSLSRNPLWFGGFLLLCGGLLTPLGGCDDEEARRGGEGEGEGEGAEGEGAEGEGGEGEGGAEGEGEGGAEGEGEGGTEGEGEGGSEGEGEGGTEGEGEGFEGEGEGEGGEGEGAVDPCLADLTGPKLLNAFSPDGKSVALHFNEPILPESGGNMLNYTITGNDNSEIAVFEATVDGEWVRLTLDPAARINGDVTYTARASNVLDVCGNLLDNSARQSKVTRAVYLTMIWHQHQPNYYDPTGDQMMSPWVRKHSTKDYYDMASMLENYPNVHVAINLTPGLLFQLELYIERLGPFIDHETNTIDVEGFLARWKGKTDPWIDLLLEETPNGSAALTEAQRNLFYKGGWCTVSTSPRIMKYFPEYETLRDANRSLYSQEQLLGLKVFFELAWFDPDFLRGRVQLPHDPAIPDEYNYVDLRDVLRQEPDGRFYLKVPLSEALARRLVVENYKIMRAVLPIHRKLRYSPTTQQGQIELLTTPYYHPILPLIYDTDLAAQQMDMVHGADRLPDQRFQFPEDASDHVARSVRYYERLFGEKPRGMWPGEGSVAEEVIPAFVANGIDYIATGQDVLWKSRENSPSYVPYRIDSDRVAGDGGSRDDEMLIFFRDNVLSDKIGFQFQNYNGEDAAREFLGDVLAQAPRFGAKDRNVVVILDGENAWESYKEHEGKAFFDALYSKLEASAAVGEILTVTPAEYIDGNPSRQIPPHPIHDQDEIEGLAAGSWIGGNFAVWIGEAEENLCWNVLAQARTTLGSSQVPRPNPLADAPGAGADPLVRAAWRAWDEVLAAEGSDWFWWFGGDMETPGNDDTPFDLAFRAHIIGMYEAMNEARELMGLPALSWSEPPPCVQKPAEGLRGPFEPSPVLDGGFTPNESEWTEEGGLFYDDDSGVAFNPADVVKRVMYGYDAQAFYVAVETKIADLTTKLGSGMSISVLTSQKHVTDAETGTFVQDPANSVTFENGTVSWLGAGAARRAKLDFAGASASLSFAKANGQGGWTAAGGHGVTVGGPRRASALVEFRLPFADLGIAGPADPLEFIVLVENPGSAGDIAPNKNTQMVFEDVTNQVFVTFEVDVSGTRIAMDYHAEIEHRPPPNGRGMIFIAGNHPRLGMVGDDWIPNTISLRNDGQGGDRIADDQIWSGTFPLMRGFHVEYKYLSAINDFAETWRGEEFNVTYRGFDVRPECERMRVADVFADKPPNGANGIPGSMSSITCE